MTNDFMNEMLVLKLCLEHSGLFTSDYVKANVTIK